MKGCKLFFGLMLLSDGVMAQAKPSYTQYVLNNYILNPALSGIENYVDVKLSNRNQWTGIDGAPVTTYLTLHGAIGKKDMRTSATSFQVPGNNPRGEEYWRTYTAPAAHHGIGFQMMNDRAGYLNRWSFMASYAYHLPLGLRTTLALGFQAGVNSVALDRTKIVWGNLDPNDPAIGYSSGELKKVKPELGAGLWLYSANYFLGFSLLNIIPGKANFVVNDKYGNSYSVNYFATAGYRIGLGEISLLPSVMFQYWKPQLSGLHVNAKLQYRDVFWVGGSYRFSNLISGYGAMAGFHLGNFFNLSYAYEVSNTSRLRAYTGNTHEIMVGFIFGNKYGDGCPKHIW